MIRIRVLVNNHSDDNNIDDQDTLVCLISCEDECGYNEVYDNVNIELDVLDCLHACAEEWCG